MLKTFNLVTTQTGREVGPNTAKVLLCSSTAVTPCTTARNTPAPSDQIPHVKGNWRPQPAHRLQLSPALQPTIHSAIQSTQPTDIRCLLAGSKAENKSRKRLTVLFKAWFSLAQKPSHSHYIRSKLNHFSFSKFIT